MMSVDSRSQEWFSLISLGVSSPLVLYLIRKSKHSDDVFKLVIFPSKCNTMVIRFDCCSTRIQNSVFLCRTPGLIKSISNVPSCLLFLDFGTYRKRVGITIAFSVYSSGPYIKFSLSIYVFITSSAWGRCILGAFQSVWQCFRSMFGTMTILCLYEMIATTLFCYDVYYTLCPPTMGSPYVGCCG